MVDSGYCQSAGKCCDVVTESCCASGCIPKGTNENCSGFCDACPEGYQCCDGVCVNMLHDTNHCGACYHQCIPVANATATCVNGECKASCNAGFVACGNACINLQNDPAHCGECHHSCGVDQQGRPNICHKGKCISLVEAVVLLLERVDP